MKLCKRCLKPKPLSEFYEHSGMADGHLNFCKECTRKRVSNYWYQNAEELREKERERWQRRKHNPDEVEKRRLYTNAWRSTKKVRAHNSTRRKLKRPDYCEVCGKTCKPHGHHESYDEPLQVLWVCTVCHRQIRLTEGKEWNDISF